MNVLDLRTRLANDYARYTRSFIKIADPRINERVERALNNGALWPEPLLQLNPTFLPGGTIEDLVADATLHSECARIFRINKSDSDHSTSCTVGAWVSVPCLRRAPHVLRPRATEGPLEVH
jgi:hypothetical protein